MIFTDGTCVTRSGITNIYVDENPHAIVVTPFHFQLASKQNCQELVDDLPPQLHRDLWCMHDGALPHFTRLVRDYLHEHFPER
ncbi:hypothetical protein BDFB_004948 [Asbolus verrucosus]|uniref:DDE 3 domain containing protein n=1 Tax=Asbolus verrucosus TaxID=1661398 RepID=A0A482VCJ3_ASBVE|nr:hypothetical protein BDFB_004948 [Asbolus verrucosus]